MLTSQPSNAGRAGSSSRYSRYGALLCKHSKNFRPCDSKRYKEPSDRVRWKLKSRVSDKISIRYRSIAEDISHPQSWRHWKHSVARRPQRMLDLMTARQGNLSRQISNEEQDAHERRRLRYLLQCLSCAIRGWPSLGWQSALWCAPVRSWARDPQVDP